MATGYLASIYALRPEPFYLGVAYVALGLLISAFLVRDTGEHVRLETESHPPEPSSLGFREVFLRTSFKDRNLFACSQAGLLNNLNDGMSWGVFPLFFASFGLGVGRIGVLKAVYPAIWGVLQVATGPLSDRWGRKGLIVGGMWVQAGALFVTVLGRGFWWWILGSVLLGLGTAMVYPALIAAVSDASHPSWRALPERLPLMEGPGLRGGCPLRWRGRRPLRARVGHRLRGSAYVRLGRRGRDCLPRGEGGTGSE